jgi:exopolyphosphatase/guanosine-5'-triphosphate,3'-diphosphate pyrophosphatase
MKYFADGQLTAKAFEGAEIAAKAVLDEALNCYPRLSWDLAYGSSGTVGAVGDVLEAGGWPAGQVTRDGLDWLLDKLLRAQRTDRLRLDGMKDDRRSVIGGGVSILRAVFDLLGIDTLATAQGALRHGVLYDMLDREHVQTDLRAVSVQRLVEKFAVEAAQSQRVQKVACQLLRQLLGTQGPAHERQRLLLKLGWAASLHEIGCHISHSDYHKHGAYMLDNTDAPGFAQHELRRLGMLVLGHRGKLRKLDANFEDPDFVAQLMCLRLAVILCHARRDPDLKGLVLQRGALPEKQFLLGCRSGWAQAFPQSAHLLREEVLAWEKTAWSLAVTQA